MTGWPASTPKGDHLRALQRLLPVLVFLLPAQLLLAQLQLPQSAQTELYFPHFANGGPASVQWQTRFTFINPNISAVAASISFYSNSGGALNLDFGNGLVSTVTFSVPPNGTYVLQTQTASPNTATGWAYAVATLPLQANVAFRLLNNGAAQLEITAEPTLPSFGYRSVATPQVGIAVANIYNSALPVLVTVYDGSGNNLGQGSLTVPPLGHSSFNLNQVVANLPASFTGNVFITPTTPQDVLIAWAVYSDSSGVISSLPEGRIGFPTPHVDQIQTAFIRLLNAYQTNLSDYGDAPQLVISTENDDNAINAFASNGSTVQINLALAELISDSPSEFAFILGHEMAHIYQQRTGKFVWYPNREWDADSWGLLMSLAAGYDPYAGAGVLGKLGIGHRHGEPWHPILGRSSGAGQHHRAWLFL